MGVPLFQVILRNPSSQFTPRSSYSPEHLSCEHFGASLANVKELNTREQRKEVHARSLNIWQWIKFKRCIHAT